MKELGVKVLSKIENLISQIEKPQSSPRSRRRGANQQAQNGEMSFVPNHEGTQLYGKQMSNNYLNTEKKVRTKLTNNAYQGEEPIQQFRITNPQTIEILSRKNMKPIHQRSDEILSKKQQNIKYIQRQLIEKERRSMVPINFEANQSAEEILHRYRRMNEEELGDFRNQYDEKNHERLRKKHLHQLSRVDKDMADLIPTDLKKSASLSKQRNLKRNYSIDVFKRMNQDNIDRRGRKTDLKNKRVEEEGGFHPVLCSKSRILAERSRSNKSLQEADINNSLHSKCKSLQSIIQSQVPTSAKVPA